MTRFSKALLVGTLLAALPVLGVACSAGNDVSTRGDAGADVVDAGRGVGDAAPDSLTVREASASDSSDEGLSFNLQPAGVDVILYWGGPILNNVPNVYFIWYGTWTGSTTPAILENLIKGFSGSPYSNILTEYSEYQVDESRYNDGGQADSGGTDAAAAHEAGASSPPPPVVYATGKFNFVSSTMVGYPRGPTLGSGDVGGVVTDLLSEGTLPVDTNAVYFVMTSADVTENDGSAGFCTEYCGYHNAAFVNNDTTIEYAFVGDPGGCLDDCSVLTYFEEAGISVSPNNNWSADAMASVIIHELAEATTDPDPEEHPSWPAWPAWLGAEGNEIADMCAWRFDPTYLTSNGSRANVNFSGTDYLIQQMWVSDADGGGHCALHP